MASSNIHDDDDDVVVPSVSPSPLDDAGIDLDSGAALLLRVETVPPVVGDVVVVACDG